MGRIIEKYKALEERFDFVLVEDTSFIGEGARSLPRLNH